MRDRVVNGSQSRVKRYLERISEPLLASVFLQPKAGQQAAAVPSLAWSSRGSSHNPVTNATHSHHSPPVRQVLTTTFLH